MRFRNFRSIGCAIGLTWAVSACSQPARLPSAPSGGTTAPTPTSAAPDVTDVLPSAGSAVGGAVIKIIGTGFMPGMVAMFDGIRGTVEFDEPATSFTTFYTETPAHAVGTVDLVVINPDGQSHRVAAGYTYIPPDSFDPNGGWGGWTLHGTDTWVAFVIRDNRLVSASCTCPSCTYDAKTPLAFAELPSVKDGEFSAVADGGAMISGRIVSASEMAGTITVPSCTTTPLTWRANRND